MITTPQTVTVSDEAVQAIDRFSEAAKPWGWVEDQGSGSTIVESENEFKAARENLDAVVAALTAALPHLALTAAPCSVEVKKLEWVQQDGKLVWDSSEYRIYILLGSKPAVYRVLKSSFGTQYVGDFVGVNAFEEAKAAAQADFERCILSQIVTKPIDVAAVRIQAFEEAYKRAAEAVQKSLEVSEDYAWDEAEGIYHLIMGLIDTHPNAIRALSPAEPVKIDHISDAREMVEPVDQWQDIAGVGERERLIIIGSYNAKGLWCEEVWHTKYLRDQQAKSASDFFMNAPHLEWVPTHFMELPTAPASKGSE